MRRREFIALLSGAATGWPLVGLTQQPTTPVIGFLTTSNPYPPLINELHSGLAETGYYEGQNVSIEYTWADGHYDRLPALAAELVRRRVDVIVAAGGTNAGTMAKATTSTIPIVVLIGGDPHELVPTAKTIAYLVNPTGPNGKRQMQDAVSQEHALGVKLSVLKASSEGDF